MIFPILSPFYNENNVKAPPFLFDRFQLHLAALGRPVQLHSMVRGDFSVVNRKLKKPPPLKGVFKSIALSLNFPISVKGPKAILTATPTTIVSTWDRAGTGSGQTTDATQSTTQYANMTGCERRAEYNYRAGRKSNRLPLETIKAPRIYQRLQ